VKVEIRREDRVIDAKDVFEKEIKTFGNGSAHIIVSNKYIGFKAIVVIEEPIGNAMSRRGKKWKKEQKE